MMKRGWYSLVPAFIILCSISIFCVGRIYDIHAGEKKSDFSRFIYYPDSSVKAIALEFHGIVADYIMLNVMTWHGEKLLAKATIEPEEWNNTYLALKVITELDPKFMDPYLLAETSLPWDAGMVEETNQLLVKAAESLPDNYRPYFFLWFNHYWFLKDPETAGMYLEKAAVIPGAPKFYKTLAARMRLQSGDIESGIFFLQEMLKETTDPTAKLNLQRRLDALTKIAVLERYLVEYAKKYGKRPGSLMDLVSAGLMKKMPIDPYGGDFYIMENGRVYTTSKLVHLKK